MSNEQIKSTIRHILTALGFVLGLIGLNKFVPVVDFLLQNLDAVWSSVTGLIGFVLILIGFFKNKERFAQRGA